MGEQSAAASIACSWCGRSIYREGGRWLATKGSERGYDALLCDANDEDGRHESDDVHADFCCQAMHNPYRDPPLTCCTCTSAMVARYFTLSERLTQPPVSSIELMPSPSMYDELLQPLWWTPTHLETSHA